MAVHRQSVLAWKIAMTFIHTIAVSSTCIRLYDRFWEQRLWWDDYLAILPTVLDVLYFASLWTGPFSGHVLFKYDPNPFRGYLFPVFLHFSILWTTRIVLALSLSRLFPPNSRPRRIMFGLVALFLVLYAIILAFTFTTCTPVNRPWYKASSSDCSQLPSGPVPVFVALGIAGDLASDLLLVVLPLIMIWRIKLRSHQRRLILVVVSASVLTIAVAVVYAVFSFSKVNKTETLLFCAMLVNLVSVTNLIVCNFLVVSLFFYRRLRRWRGAATDSECESASTTSEKTSDNGRPPNTRRLQPTFEIPTSPRPVYSTQIYSTVNLTEITQSSRSSSYYSSDSSKHLGQLSSTASAATGNLDLDGKYTDKDLPPWTFSSGHS
ncbi:unnamed protein product [Cyclocybe aegerita]|uniref:Rhodopsin domain-containing protein n=1 Tax=Cyclocybe aegerita TaxID=1973307 RepID=A0A8S0WPJ2_CYCAE|nr:unnamed protein product [Cyclocybe aegerita]